MTTQDILTIAFLDATGAPENITSVRVEASDSGATASTEPATSTAIYGVSTSLAETSAGSGRWFASLNFGRYKIYKTISGVETFVREIYHSTLETKKHVRGEEYRHKDTAIDTADVNGSVTGRISALGATTATALDGLLEDLSALTASVTVSLGEIGDDIDDIDARLTLLEGATATAPTGIADRHGALGIVIDWTPQTTVDGVRYYARWLYKHASESAPIASVLKHQTSGISEAMCIVLYEAVHADISANPYTDIVLYYQIGAKAAGDADIVWAGIESITVVFPSYTQILVGVLNSVAACCGGGNAHGGSELMTAVDCPDTFPIADATPPTRDFFILRPELFAYEYTQLILRSTNPITGAGNIILRNPTSGETNAFALDIPTHGINPTSMSMTIPAGTQLQIYTLDDVGLGGVTIWLRRVIR